MKKLIIGGAVLILLYCAYWFAVCLLLPPRLAPALQELHQDGLDVRMGVPKITGFPAQFRVPIEQLQIVQYQMPLPANAVLGQSGTFIDPNLPFEYGLEIERGIFSARAFWPMTQKINEVTFAILTLPLYSFGETTAYEKSAPSRTQIEAGELDISVSGLRAKNILISGKAVTLTALNEASTQNIALKSIEALELDFIDGQTHGALDLTASGAALDPDILGKLADGLGTQIQTVDLKLDYTARLGVDGETLELMSATLDEAVLLWGKAQLSALGEISRNEAGLQGEVTVNIEQSADLLAELRQADVINAQQFFSAAMMLGSSNETRSLTLSFRDSKAYLGPIPLGEIPF